MHGRFRHATHIVRVAVVFLVGFVAFAIARRAFVPEDFGTLGFYRAGAIDDAREWPVAYLGREACEECHVGKYWSDFAFDPPTDPVEDNKHSVLACESCHGPLAVHGFNQQRIEAGEDISDAAVPQVSSDERCLLCHLKVAARPESHPQVFVGDGHGESTGDETCESCHRVHRPRTDEDEDDFF